MKKDWEIKRVGDKGLVGGKKPKGMVGMVLSIVEQPQREGAKEREDEDTQKTEGRLH